MSRTPPHRVFVGPGFERDRETLRKKHYRKNKAANEKFQAYVERVLDALTFDPYLNGQGDPERFPTRQATPGWEMLKHRFPMPDLRGNAGLGRIIYFFNRDEGIVLVSHVYTHEQFPGRPPAKDLMTAFEALRKWAERASTDGGQE